MQSASDLIAESSLGFAQASVPTHICARRLRDILNAIYEAMNKELWAMIRKVVSLLTFDVILFYYEF